MADNLARWVAENKDHYECDTVEEFDRVFQVAMDGCKEAATASWTSWAKYKSLNDLDSVLESKEEKENRTRWLRQKDNYVHVHTKALWTFVQRTIRALLKLKMEFRFTERRHPADIGSDIFKHLKEASRVSEFFLKLCNDMMESIDTAVLMSSLPFYCDGT